MVKPVLGRGLGALLGGAGAAKPAPATPAPAPASPFAAPAAPVTPAPTAPAPAVPAGEVIRKVPLSEIHPCAFQPRKDFAPEAIQDLAASIKEQGIVQPLLVRKSADGYELIAGERRWRAAQVVGLSEVPVIVREATDAQLLELALIENLQRENLNAIEEALGYNQLLGQFGLTQEQVSIKVGKSRAAVANALRLLKLAPELQSYLRHGQLSVGHAKVILGLVIEAEQKLAAERIIKDGLSVRETEEMVAGMLGKSSASEGVRHSAKKTPPKDAHVADLERKLQERFGTRVALKYKAGKGSVEIRFFNDDDLERVLQVAGIQMD
ncbi:MAG: ParB/RepB/Spo0J family partition protein [Verrucomicrobiota bacterium]